MFQCKICGKEFPTKQKLGGHVSSHSRLGKKREKPNKEKRFCLNCGTLLNSHQTKYCKRNCQHEYQQKQWEEKWLSGEISGFYETDHWGGVPDRIRTYLFNRYNSKCAKCGWGETNPYSKTIPLEIEHIDGNYRNNRPENVTLLCPNCHSLTKTYRGANKGHGRGKTWKPITDVDKKIIS